MICVTLKGYTRPCGGITSGVSRIRVGDPSDFDFTQVAAGDPYTVIARRTGATAVGGGNLFPITFGDDEAELKFARSSKGCSVKYEHTLEAQLPELSQGLTKFLMSLDAAGCCCGLLLVIETSAGKNFVMGEGYVNGARIPKFKVKQGNSTGTTGKLIDDFSGGNLVITGEYGRPLYEFTGGSAAIDAMEPVAP